MALRNLRYEPDEILRKKARIVREITPNVRILVEDLHDTMQHYNGVGLAAPQVGILKRIVVIDDNESELKCDMINPEIIETEGVQSGDEACLSVPRVIGTVERPLKITVRFTDINGEEKSIDAEGRSAIILSHELDHLDGVLYKDIAIPGTIRENTEKERTLNITDNEQTADT